MVARSSNAANMIRIFCMLYPINIFSILNIGPPPRGESRKFFFHFPNANNNSFFFVNGIDHKIDTGGIRSRDNAGYTLIWYPASRGKAFWHFTYSLGVFLTFVACSNAKAILSSLSSSQGRATISKPIGRPVWL